MKEFHTKRDIANLQMGELGIFHTPHGPFLVFRSAASGNILWAKMGEHGWEEVVEDLRESNNPALPPEGYELGN